LHQGDRVAIVAPAAQFRADELMQALDVIKEMGLKPVLGPEVRKLNSENVYDAPLENRTRELMWAMTNPNVEGVIAVLGGFGSAELLPHLDYRAIRDAGKVFVGKSDLTAINSALLKKSGLISINGKTAVIRRTDSGNFMDTDVTSLKHTLSLLMSDDTWGTEAFKINQFVPRVITPGKFSGRVIGGNLETLTCLVGTGFFPNPNGAVLFIEDVHKSGVNIARRLLQLKMAGVLDKVVGVVIGEFAEVELPKGTQGDYLINDTLQRFFHNIPSVYGYSFSHGSHIMPIPIGSTAHVDTDTCEVYFDFKMS